MLAKNAATCGPFCANPSWLELTYATVVCVTDLHLGHHGVLNGTNLPCEVGCVFLSLESDARTTSWACHYCSESLRDVART